MNGSFHPPRLLAAIYIKPKLVNVNRLQSHHFRSYISETKSIKIQSVNGYLVSTNLPLKCLLSNVMVLNLSHRMKHLDAN